MDDFVISFFVGIRVSPIAHLGLELATEFLNTVRVQPFFLMPPDLSVCFRVFFWGGEYVCPSYGPLKIRKSAKSERKSVRLFIKNFGIHVYKKNLRSP